MKLEESVSPSPVEYIFYSPTLKDRGWSGPGWYFWDESWTELYGPYMSADRANEKLKEYAKDYL